MTDVEQQDTQIVPEDQLWDMPIDARVVALRWDIVPWGLILDLDVPESEAKDAKMRRGWLVFDGLSEITMPLTCTRLPTGFWITGPIAARRTSSPSRLQDFTFNALLPTFDDKGQPMEGPASEVKIRAMHLLGVLSGGAEHPEEWGLAYGARIGLATDGALQARVEEALRGMDPNS